MHGDFIFTMVTTVYLMAAAEGHWAVSQSQKTKK